MGFFQTQIPGSQADCTDRLYSRALPLGFTFFFFFPNRNLAPKLKCAAGPPTAMVHGAQGQTKLPPSSTESHIKPRNRENAAEQS